MAANDTSDLFASADNTDATAVSTTTNYTFDGSVMGKLEFEGFTTLAVITFSGGNMTSFTGLLNYTDSSVDIRAAMNFYDSMFLRTPIHSRTNTPQYNVGFE